MKYREGMREAFWQFIARRHQRFLHRINPSAYKKEKDKKLEAGHYTNVFRVLDRVTQFLLQKVQPEKGKKLDGDLFLRTLLFKTFNSPATWENLLTRLKGRGVTRYWPHAMTVKGWDADEVCKVLDDLKKLKVKLFRGAYVMPPAHAMKRPEKKTTHKAWLSVIDDMVKDEVWKRLRAAGSLEKVYRVLTEYDGMGPFLSFQYAIDLNYSRLLDHSEMDFVVCGPGARNGIKMVFEGVPRGWTYEDAVHWCWDDMWEAPFSIPNLGGHVPQLIDLQNCFCEASKYFREGQGPKKNYRAHRDDIDYVLPASWGTECVEPVPVASLDRPVNPWQVK